MALQRHSLGYLLIIEDKGYGCNYIFLHSKSPQNLMTSNNRLAVGAACELGPKLDYWQKHLHVILSVGSFRLPRRMAAGSQESKVEMQGVL